MHIYERNFKWNHTIKGGEYSTIRYPMPLNNAATAKNGLYIFDSLDKENI